MSPQTITAFATPPGESAIGVIRVSGCLSEQITLKAFNLKKKPTPRYAAFGRYSSLSGELIDECIYVYFNYESSYTGEDSLEIYSHGNPFIQRKILEDLIARGCRCAEAGEFTRRAFMNGKMDLSQAEAVEEIIRARSDRSLSAAQKLLSGELGKRISSWSNRILNLLAEIESQIDFSDEDIPVFHVEHFLKEITALELDLQNTENTARYTSTVHEGVNMVIVGAPNAGKSSLLNTLTGEERALVSDEAGTTRDFISENIVLGKHRIRLIDTAGIRSNTQTPIEKSGINRAIDCVKQGDFYLFVIDSASLPPALTTEVMSYLLPEKTLLVFNKADLNPVFDTGLFLPNFARISLSLFDFEASKVLTSKIIEVLESRSIVPEADILIVSARQAAALKNARMELEAAKDSIGAVSLEFLSSRLRAVLNELAEVLGRFDNEKVLDKVFSNFCIGK